jgi:hypothetical protein
VKFLRRTVVAVSIGLLSAGCYSVRPAAGLRPELGKTLVLELSDAGRVALGPAIGQSIMQVTGKVVSADSNAYVLSVTETQSLNSLVQVWRGEVVTFQASHVSRVFERQFSPLRTAILAGAVVVGAAAFLGPIRTKFDPQTDPDDPPIEESIGRRRPGRSMPPLFLRRLTPPRSF